MAHPLLQFFTYAHLPEELQTVSKHFPLAPRKVYDMDAATVMSIAAQRKLVATVKPEHMQAFYERDFFLACANVLKEIHSKGLIGFGCKRDAFTHMLHSNDTIDAALLALVNCGLVREVTFREGDTKYLVNVPLVQVIARVNEWLDPTFGRN